MDKIKVGDKIFSKYILYDDILVSVKRIAKTINKDYKGDMPVFIGILNGAFMFAADLLKEFDGDCELTFIALSSYSGVKTTGVVKQMIGLNLDIKDRRVIVLEDIVDSGITVDYLKKQLLRHTPSDIRVATLLLKPAALQTGIMPDYVGMEIPNDFIVGYGLDYEGHGRNYKDIYKISG